jgi:acyl-CoA thioester hydrolase
VPENVISQKKRVLLALRWGDMDAYNHINNVQYVRLLEEARVRLLGSPSQPRTIPAEKDAVPLFTEVGEDTISLVSRHVIEYRAPLEYRSDPVAVDLWVARVGGASFDIGYEISEPDGSRSYLLAETTVVFADRESGTPRRVSARERALLKQLLAGPVPFRRAG